MVGYQELQDTKTWNSMLKVSCIFVTLLEPIEQNVMGNRGIYELIYFVKDSKNLDRFKKQAESFDSYTITKTTDQIESLVSLWFLTHLVLEDAQE